MAHASYIPFNLPSIGSEEVEEVVATLRSGWLTSGPRTKRFETDFGAYCGSPHALAVNSCTAGLHLALAALGIGPGDEVITTPLTFAATVNTIVHVGATPVLADIGADGNIDPGRIESSIGPRTRAILPVHLAGLSCDMPRIWEIAARHGLKVVEDAAHAAGASYDDTTMVGGGASDAVAFSFYATKNMTTGEGGMVTSPHAELAEEMRMLCLHGINKDAWNRNQAHGKWFYQITRCGFKYNMSDIQSAIGIHQLKRLDSFIEERQRQAEFYNRAFADIDEIELPPQRGGGRHAWHLYSIRLNLPRLDISRDAFIEELDARGVGASVHFIPIQLHPYYADRIQGDCPEALALYPRMISLPLYPGLSESQLQDVVNAVTGIVTEFRKARPVFRKLATA